MGLETTRCMTVSSLAEDLKRMDGDTLVRFRDGGATYPGVYLITDSRRGHVDIGSPYPVAERTGGRRSSKPKVWVLVRRYEWEDQSNETEFCDTFVFRKRDDAVRKAVTLMRSDMRRHGHGVTSADMRCEEKAMLFDFRTRFPRHLVQLTDGDNVVYELYRKSIG